MPLFCLVDTKHCVFDFPFVGQFQNFAFFFSVPFYGGVCLLCVAILVAGLSILNDLVVYINTLFGSVYTLLNSPFCVLGIMGRILEDVGYGLMA